ncbi:hypothetical protein E2C01_001858 [Portunus trituberculatus]|uniref:Uncharacterized protein n=1 Tax=Portunus trituberculatus TaxID=210409 RepID=A0A5B7CKK6_PORTR|nr:hypothetical protein [Portunus trituberculatus]
MVDDKLGTEEKVRDIGYIIGSTNKIWRAGDERREREGRSREVVVPVTRGEEQLSHGQTLPCIIYSEVR